MAQQKERYEINKVEILKKQQEYYEENKDNILIRIHEYYDENVENIKQKHREYYESHRDELLLKSKEYSKEHPEIHSLAVIKCDENRSLRLVSWGQEGIKEFERNKPKNMTTDYYIPMQGDGVSGLHVIWNLQYLTKSKNSSKHNKCNLTEVSEWYGKLLEKTGLK